MAIVTVVVMERGGTWPGPIGASENLTLWHDDTPGSTRGRLDALHRQRDLVRVAVLACNEAIDPGSVKRRTDVAHDLLGAVARAPGGRLFLGCADGASVEVRRELLLLAGKLSFNFQGSRATVLVRFGTAGDRQEGLRRAGGRHGPRLPLRSACTRSP